MREIKRFSVKKILEKKILENEERSSVKMKMNLFKWVFIKVSHIG